MRDGTPLFVAMVRSQIRKSALWAAGLTVPAFVLSIWIFKLNEGSALTAFSVLAGFISLPVVAIVLSGVAVPAGPIGPTVAICLQFPWLFVWLLCIRVIVELRSDVATRRKIKVGKVLLLVFGTATAGFLGYPVFLGVVGAFLFPIFGAVFAGLSPLEVFLASIKGIPGLYREMLSLFPFSFSLCFVASLAGMALWRSSSKVSSSSRSSAAQGESAI
jgi:hypothetical protein